MDCPEIPDFLLVKNRVPLTPEQKAHLALVAQTAQSQQPNLLELQKQARREKDREYAKKYEARKKLQAERAEAWKGGVGKVLPPQDKDALKFIREFRVARKRK